MWLKIFQQTNSEPDDFTGKFYQTFREELTLNLLKLFQKFAEEGTYPSPFYKATITLTSKPDKDITHKKENYRAISLMNIHTKILNKILANKIQQHIKGSYIKNKWNISQGCKDFSIYTNQSMQYTILTNWRGKNVIMLIDAEKAFDKIQHLFMILKISRK